MKNINFIGKKGKGHYSPAVEYNGLIYISGQLPVLEGTKQPVSENIEDQTKLVLKKLNKILQLANSRKENVLSVTIFIPDICHWDKVNEIYANFFGNHRPSRTIVPTNKLHFNCLIELNAIAYKEKKE